MSKSVDVNLASPGQYDEHFLRELEQAEARADELQDELEALRGERDYQSRARRVAIRRELRDLQDKCKAADTDWAVGLIAAMQRDLDEFPTCYWRVDAVDRNGEPIRQRYRARRRVAEAVRLHSQLGTRIIDMSCKPMGQNKEWEIIFQNGQDMRCAVRG